MPEIGTALADQIFAVIDRTECARAHCRQSRRRKGLKGTDIVDSFDIVGFNLRGVGPSTPAIDCLSDEQSESRGVVSA